LRRRRSTPGTTGERGVGVEVVGVDVGRGAEALGKEKNIRIHPVDLHALVRGGVLAQIESRFSHLIGKEVR
jgi:hypothetical protein